MGVYTIAGGKGGVGKSTTTASVGTVLHRSGYDVALVDADLSMANLADVVGATSDRGIDRVLAGEADVDDVVVSVDDGPDVVPGGRTVEQFEASDPANLRRAIDPLAADYDVVLVDTGAGLSHESLVATGLADGTVLVTTPDDAAVADVAKTGEFVDHADATVIGAVVTRTGEGTDLGSIADRLGVPLLGAIPEDPAVGTDPVTDGDAGTAYEELAATLATRFDEDASSVDATASVAWTPPAERPATGNPSAAASGLTSSDD